MSGLWYFAGLNETKPLREDARTQWLRDTTHSGGRLRNCRSAWRKNVHLEVVSAIQTDFVRFSPCGRLPRIPSLIRAAAWVEKCGGAEETFTLSATGPAGEGRARLSAHVDHLLAGSSPSKSVGLPPLKRCIPRPPMLRMQAASRRSSGPALHEARTLLGASAGSSRIRFFGKPIRTVPSKAAVSHRSILDLQNWLQLWTRSEAHARWRRNSEWIRARRQQRRNKSRFSSAADQEEKGSSA